MRLRFRTPPFALTSRYYGMLTMFAPTSFGWNEYFDCLDFPGNDERRAVVIDVLLENDLTRLLHLRGAIPPQEWLSGEKLMKEEVVWLQSIIQRSWDKRRLHRLGLLWRAPAGL